MTLTGFAILLCAMFPPNGEAGDGLEGHREIARALLEEGLRECEAHAVLSELTSAAGHRLSGSLGAEIAVDLTTRMMKSRGFDEVRVESVMVPRWARGDVEDALIISAGGAEATPLSICALGGSVATPEEGVIAEVVEVRSFEELRALGDRVRGKIVFFNRPMDPTVLNTFSAYEGAVDQRGSGAVEAAKMGGVAALVRSVTTQLDDVPHTGSMRYREDVPKVPAAAVSTLGANHLSGLLRNGERVRVRLRLSCKTLSDVPSGNVLGQITGSDFPDEIILVGGHLDSWDKGTGAHDDGAGCAQAIEVLRLIREIGLTPRRTIRAVLFMNEESGNRGGPAYASAPGRARETHVAALESDRGGLDPRGFAVEGDSLLMEKVRRWQPLFEELGAGQIKAGHAGVDISAVVKKGVPGFGLLVDNHRYFDYHHSDNDTIDKVHRRELEMGAILQALLAYLISEEGL
ncbi:MAG: M20/M25/M40 family metallo-hydrolase [Bacteroidota bacterium]